MQTHAVVDERCDKCGREQVRFYTQQLRSADEGSTVFYVCDCGNKYVDTAWSLTGTFANDFILQMEYEQLRYGK